MQLPDIMDSILGYKVPYAGDIKDLEQSEGDFQFTTKCSTLGIGGLAFI